MSAFYIALSVVLVIAWFGIVLTIADFVLGRIISRAGKGEE